MIASDWVVIQTGLRFPAQATTWPFLPLKRSKLGPRLSGWVSQALIVVPLSMHRITLVGEIISCTPCGSELARHPGPRGRLAPCDLALVVSHPLTHTGVETHAMRRKLLPARQGFFIPMMPECGSVRRARKDATAYDLGYGSVLGGGHTGTHQTRNRCVWYVSHPALCIPVGGTTITAVTRADASRIAASGYSCRAPIALGDQPPPTEREASWKDPGTFRRKRGHSRGVFPQRHGITHETLQRVLLAPTLVTLNMRPAT